ncbi:MAG: hypothetical protein WBB01_06405 [Phormidesmis sp.]
MGSPSRLSQQQHQAAIQKAIEFQQEAVAIAQAKGKGQGQEQSNFFPEVFRIAAQLIEKDAQDFCDRAELVFEEIEAHGQEPDLDRDWLDELTGEKDNFYFSTDSLLTELPPLPGRKRGRKPKPPDEKTVIEAVQMAVQEAEDVLAITHMENPSDWIARIHMALEGRGGAASFAELRKATKLSPGALFLGLLLGQEHWDMSQSEFYGKVEVRGRFSD